MMAYLQEMEGLERELESLSNKKMTLQEQLATSSPEALREKYVSGQSASRSLALYDCRRWHTIECELKVESDLSVAARLAEWDEKMEALEQRGDSLQEELQHHQRIYESDKTSLEKLFGSKREGIVPLYHQFFFKSDISSTEPFLTALHLIMGERCWPCTQVKNADSDGPGMRMGVWTVESLDQASDVVQRVMQQDSKESRFQMKTWVLDDLRVQNTSSLISRCRSAFSQGVCWSLDLDRH